jgi:LmbE family N-acetylglucosaminyl deacetylase
MPVEEQETGAPTPTEPEGPKKIVTIFPHADDAEFSCSGSVARWVAEGNEVVYVLVTNGDKGSDDPTMTSERLIATRKAEQQAACDILGVKEVHFLGHEDAMLVNSLDLRRDLVRVIRKLKPDTVVTFDPTVRFVGGSYFNHPDHRVTGDVTLDAVYPAARDRMTFPELLDEGLEPHKVREVYLAGATAADHFIDITDYLETKIAALRAHASQMGDRNPEEMIREWAREGGKRHDPPVEYAEGFRHFVLE